MCYTSCNWLWHHETCCQCVHFNFLLKEWSDSSTNAYKDICVKPKPQADSSAACID